MSSLYAAARPLLMRLDAETAHRLSLAALKAGLGPRYGFAHPALRVDVLGKSFPNPLGLAAGFDKNAEVLAPLMRMGFGFVEAGTVTPRPQPGNPRPRVFRDIPNESIVNRMGFPGRGLDAFEKNLRAFRRRHPGYIVGANIGINKDARDPLEEYGQGLARLSPLADYIAVNVSSPNTAGLRELQARDRLDGLLQGLARMRAGAPVLLKVAPDLDAGGRADIAGLALRYGVDGLVVCNTTVSRPSRLDVRYMHEKGGLSGRLLTALATDVIRDFHRLTQGRLPIIGVGGVSSAQDAYDKIRAGASLVQVYSAFAYRGPGLLRDILEGLPPLLEKDGFSTVAEAVGKG